MICDDNANVNQNREFLQIMPYNLFFRMNEDKENLVMSMKITVNEFLNVFPIYVH